MKILHLIHFIILPVLLFAQMHTVTFKRHHIYKNYYWDVTVYSHDKYPPNCIPEIYDGYGNPVIVVPDTNCLIIMRLLDIKTKRYIMLDVDSSYIQEYTDGAKDIMKQKHFYDRFYKTGGVKKRDSLQVKASDVFENGCNTAVLSPSTFCNKYPTNIVKAAFRKNWRYNGSRGVWWSKLYAKSVLIKWKWLKIIYNGLERFQGKGMLTKPFKVHLQVSFYMG